MALLFWFVDIALGSSTHPQVYSSLDFPYVGWGALSSDCLELSLSMCLSNGHNRLFFFSASRTLYTWMCARGWKENRKSDVRMPIHKVTPISDSVSSVLNQLPTRLYAEKVSSRPGRPRRCSIYPFPGISLVFTFNIENIISSCRDKIAVGHNNRLGYIKWWMLIYKNTVTPSSVHGNISSLSVDWFLIVYSAVDG